MHVPSTVRLLLIAHPSFSLSPEAPVYPAFSDPARSTKLMTENFSVFLVSSVRIYLNSIVMIVWARLLVWFMRVLPMDLLSYPSSVF